jgi:hypothetical protein
VLQGEKGKEQVPLRDEHLGQFGRGLSLCGVSLIKKAQSAKLGLRRLKGESYPSSER